MIDIKELLRGIPASADAMEYLSGKTLDFEALIDTPLRRSGVMMLVQSMAMAFDAGRLSAISEATKAIIKMSDSLSRTEGGK